MYPKLRKQKAELMENDNFHMFAANRKQERQTSACLLQMEMENRSIFSLVGKQ
jgi:hypothetical protein